MNADINVIKIGYYGNSHCSIMLLYPNTGYPFRYFRLVSMDGIFGYGASSRFGHFYRHHPVRMDKKNKGSEITSWPAVTKTHVKKNT